MWAEEPRCACAKSFSYSLQTEHRQTFNHSYLSSSLYGDIVQPSKTYGYKTASVDITIQRSTYCTGCFCYTWFVVFSVPTRYDWKQQCFPSNLNKLFTLSYYCLIKLYFFQYLLNWYMRSWVLLWTLSQLLVLILQYANFNVVAGSYIIYSTLKCLSGCLFSMLSNMEVSLVCITVIITNVRLW